MNILEESKSVQDPTVEAAFEELKKSNFLALFRAKQASLWKKEPANLALINKSLGWIDAPETTAMSLGALRSFVLELGREEIESAVVLGMGGSSLCCEVFKECFPHPNHKIRLEVLDSTSPEAVSALQKKLNLKKTMFIVSSKSGSTMEPNCFMDYFFSETQKVLGNKAPSRFIAVTDPKTSLEKKASQMRFRKIWPGNPNVGGRYSALTNFGIVPAAISGLNVEDILNRARQIRATILSENNPALNPATVLGAFLGANARKGKDKLTLILSPQYKAFGLWIEQLIAESTGKEGRGIVPIIAEDGLSPKDIGSDRIFVGIIDPQDNASADLIKKIKENGASCLSYFIENPYELSEQFFLWEAATATAGFLLGINPFDQPNVQAAKDLTVDILSKAKKGRIAEEKPFLRSGEAQVFCDETLKEIILKSQKKPNWPLTDLLKIHLTRLKAGDYAVILAYAQPEAKIQKELELLRSFFSKTYHVPFALEFGPRYLHSTGQLYKGGGSGGLFLEIAFTRGKKLPIPGRPWGFETLIRAQALGDYSALKSSGHRILRLDFPADEFTAIKTVVQSLSSKILRSGQRHPQ